MSLDGVKWTWADTKVHPAIKYPSSWIDDIDPTNVTTKLIAMIKSFNPRTSTPVDVVDSLNQGNQGTIDKHPKYYLDITCNPYGKAFKALLAYQHARRYFDIILAPITNYMTDQAEDNEVGQPSGAWGPQLEVYRGCKIVDSNERYAFGTEPTVTFSCVAMRFVWGEAQVQQVFGDGILGRTKSDVALNALINL